MVFDHVPLRLKSLLVSIPADNIAADFTDYSFTEPWSMRAFARCSVLDLFPMLIFLT